MSDETQGFSEAERAAMKERAAELRKASGKGAKKRAEDAQDCLDKIAALPDGDREVAERIHALVSENAPGLDPRTWYGMPAYAKNGQVVCFLKPASKFGSRYHTFGFNDIAHIDEGNVWPDSYAILHLTGKDEEFFAELIRRAAS